MQLNVREAARLLNLSEKTLYRWVREKKLPASKVHEQYRFNRAELLEWATSQQMQVSPELLREINVAPAPIVALADALRAGGIHDAVSGTDKLTALGAVVRLMPLAEEVDREFLLRLLLARESLASTGLGGGIALPHVRNPIVMHVSEPLITLCFLQKPVHTLFTIISPSTRAHLNLLARLAFALRQPAFADAVSRRNAADILRQAETVDAVAGRSNQGP